MTITEIWMISKSNINNTDINDENYSEEGIEIKKLSGLWRGIILSLILYMWHRILFYYKAKLMLNITLVVILIVMTK